MTGDQRLTLDDDLDLIGGDSDDGYTIEAVAGTSFGNPVPVESVIASFLRDGSIVSKFGDENREMAIPVRISAPDGVALALGEKRLNLATGKRTTLAWTPPDGIGPTTVFDVLTSSLGRVEDDWDLDEVRGVRTYLLRLVCLPFGRSTGKFVDIATSPPGGTSGTNFYSAESTANWSSYATSPRLAPSFAVDSTKFVQGTGSIKAGLEYWHPGQAGETTTGPNGAGGTQTTFTFTNNGGVGYSQIVGLSADTGDGGYISAAIRFGGPIYDGSRLARLFQATTPGVWVEVTSFAAVGIEAHGFVRYRWPVAGDQVLTGFRFETYHATASRQFGVPTPELHFDDFRILDTAGTDQQIVKQIQVEGSARTTGSLHIGSAVDSVALGHVLVATMPASEVPQGFNIEARTWVSQGTVTADATAINGSFYTPDTTTYSASEGKPIFNVPVGMLHPGAYTIVSLVKTNASTVTAGVQAQLNVNGTLVGVLDSAEITTTSTTTTWQFVTVGTLHLPPVPVQNADGTTSVRLLFKGATMANVYLIPAWQVDGKPVADYSIVDCGTGTASGSGSSSHLWLDSPSVDQPRGGLWRGPTANRLNTRSAWPDAKRPGTHTFRPGVLTAFLVSAAAFGPTLELEYSPAWFGNAGL